MTSVRSLTALFLRQELVLQHKGELLGKLWLLLQPAVYIFIFMTIFSQVMGAKLAVSFETDLPASYAYSIYLVSGLLAWQLFANTVQQMGGVYQQKSTIVRKVPVSLTWLPLYIPLTELITYAIVMGLFTAYLLVIGQMPSWQHLWVMPIIALLMILAYSIGLIVASISVFIPDIRRAVSLLLQVMFWGTPIVYVAQILPDWASSVILLNPVYWGVENIQQIYLHQPLYTKQLWGLLLLDTLLVMVALWLAKRLETDIRDLL